MDKEFSKRIRSNFEQFFREKHPEWKPATGSKNTFPGWRLYERRLSENSPDTKIYILLMVDAQRDEFRIDIAINDTGDIPPWEAFTPISEAVTNNRFPLALLWGDRAGFYWQISVYDPLLSLEQHCTDAFEKIDTYALPFFERVAHIAKNP
jgi:hypothetical protein